MDVSHIVTDSDAFTLFDIFSQCLVKQGQDLAIDATEGIGEALGTQEGEGKSQEGGKKLKRRKQGSIRHPWRRAGNSLTSSRRCMQRKKPSLKPR